VPIRAILTTNNGEAMLPFLCAGGGIALMAEFAVRRELETGRLVEGSCGLVHAARRSMSGDAVLRT